MQNLDFTQVMAVEAFCKIACLNGQKTLLNVILCKATALHPASS